MTLPLPGRPSPDWRFADLLEIGVATIASIRVRLAGSVLTPTAATLTTCHLDGTVYASPVVTLGTTSTATDPATSATQTPDIWEHRWSLTIGGIVYNFRNPVYVVGSIPAFVIDEEDLYREVSELRHASRLPPGQTDWQPQITEGGYAMIAGLTSDGRRPWLAVDPIDARKWHLAEALARACGTFISDGYFQSEAERWRREAKHQAETCRLTYRETPTIHDAQGPIRSGSAGRPRWL